MQIFGHIFYSPIFQDGIDLFNSEILLTNVDGESRQIEIIWDESRESWLSLLTEEITRKPVKVLNI